MLKEAAKKRCHGIDESRIKLIIKKDWWGYITGAWYVQVKEAEYIRMLEALNEELVRKTELLERERDALTNDLYEIVNNHVTPCCCCMNFDPSTTVCEHEGDVDCFTWRGVPKQPEEE